MAAKKQKYTLSDADKLAVAQMGYGENVGQSDDVIKMTLRSALNRWISPRDEEFGATMPEVLNKGYYAVQNKNVPYTEATSGNWANPDNQQKFQHIQNMLDTIIAEQDFRKAMFYFRPEEEEMLRKGRISKKTGKQVYDFNFNAVKPRGKAGPYNTYSY